MIPIKVDSSWRGHADCKNCAIRGSVLFGHLTEDDLKLIHAPIDDLEYSAGSVLFHQQDAAKHIFTIKRGLVKVTRLLPDGTERIVRILRAGDVAGLEATVGDTYDNGAYALRQVSVCRIPIGVLRKLAAHSPRLHSSLMQKWANQVRESDNWIAELTHGPSRQRVARLILKLADTEEPSLATLFGREEMAMMLGLTVETVSRAIAAMTREGIIHRLDLHGRRYRLERDALDDVAVPA